MYKKITISLMTAILVTACAGNKEPRGFGGDTDRKLYEEALASIGSDDKAVIAKLNILELNYPQSSNLPEAMILKLYALYTTKRYEEALAQANRFIRLYPDHKSTPYAYYIKGMSNQARMMDIRRDQGPTLDALENFKELDRTFPDSNYAALARNQMIEAENMIAMKELEIGKFYAQKGQASAAAERFQKVIEGFDHTSAVPEALYRMAELHYNLQSPDLAVKYLHLLQSKYPENFWTAQAGKMINGNKKTKRLVIPNS